MTDTYARGTLINQIGAVFVPVADQDRALARIFFEADLWPARSAAGQL